jgi:hypothetical protein
MITKEERDSLLHDHWCRWCGSRIHYDNNVRSSATDGRILLEIHDKQTPHRCYEALRSFSSQKLK